MVTQSVAPRTAGTPSYLIPFITVTILFCFLGFLTNLNSNLMPHVKSLFDLTYGQAMLVTAAWFFAYLIFSVPSGKLIEAVGYKRTLVISLFIMVAGALMFIPAANSISFPLFLTAIFVLATGVTALQTSANPYVSILGPESSAAARLTLAQAFNSASAALAPLMVGRFILTDPSKVSTKAAIAHTVEGPYIAIAATLFVLALAVMLMKLPAITLTRATVPGTEGDVVVERSIWSYPHTVLAMIGVFFYVGIEIALAAIAINYFRLQGIDSIKTATTLASLYFIGIMGGRFLGSVLMTWIKANQLLAALGLLGVALLFISMFSHGMVAAWTLVLCGLANSIMYPNIFVLGIADLGPLTSKGSGVITMGNFGGAVIPPLFGLLADKIGIQYAFVILICGYLYVVYYGVIGYKPARAS